MEIFWIIIGLFILLVFKEIFRSKNNNKSNYITFKKYTNKNKTNVPENKYYNIDTDNKEPSFDYTKGYKQKWMFTYNEKDAYYKLKEITDSMGLYLFAKVRLFDLVEPKRDIEKRQGHIFKIQAKHVDFVICDEKLVARAIIELDDNSHDSQERKDRDDFVNTVLYNCGYKILHIKAIDKEVVEEFLKPAAPTTAAQ